MPAAMWAMHGGKVFDYVCGKLEQSKTQGAAGVHIQGWGQFAKRIRLTAILKMFPATCYHWEPCAGTEAQNEKYCKKTATQIGDFECFGKFQKQGASAIKPIAVIEGLVRSGATTREIFRDKTPGVFACMSTRHRGIDAAVEAFRDDQEEKALFTLGQFGWEPLKWGKQIDGGDESYTWVIAGAAGIGKTEFAYAHFKNPLIVKSLDDLGRFERRRHDGIIFDDFDDALHALNRTTQTSIAEQDRASSIKIRYKQAFIPGGTRKIFTTNAVDGAIFNPADSCKRRHRIRCLERVVHPSGRGPAAASRAIVPDVQADASSSRDGVMGNGPDGLSDDPPGELVRANAAFSFEVPESSSQALWAPADEGDDYAAVYTGSWEQLSSQ